MKSCYLILRKSWGVYYGVESESDNGGDGDIDGGSDVPDLYGRICGQNNLILYQGNGNLETNKIMNMRGVTDWKCSEKTNIYNAWTRGVGGK